MESNASEARRVENELDVQGSEMGCNQASGNLIATRRCAMRKQNEAGRRGQFGESLAARSSEERVMIQSLLYVH